MDRNGVTSKTCSKCGEEKALSKFPKRMSAPDGYRNDCKDCRREEAAERYKNNGEDIRRRVNEKNRKNPEQNRTRAKAWAKKNPARVRAISKKWKADNPEQHRLFRRKHKQTRRARDFQGGVPDADHLLVLLRQPCCLYCDSPFDNGVFLLTMTVDHVLPLARGGTNHASNLVAVCRGCNASKGDRILYMEWLPPGLVRDQTFTPDEVEAYCIEESAKQRAFLKEQVSSEKSKPGLAA